jgi:hypothetical protein
MESLRRNRSNNQKDPSFPQQVEEKSQWEEIEFLKKIVAFEKAFPSVEVQRA